ncbi:ribbon-helix-helix domain-containing protein [Rhizobium rosettiformans]|uniref:ribbon-helix-helix domain-containing protein n=1 Tax=Rhizobium rosettiformans TaxID=1368430 RepID=UPI00285EA26A|nr:ribbon-helix-helix domain-containing protein [Rhizobium rosettiformans]MDR7029816.1 Arc/MetJ-type ribon-helix-helix transcriptional regulator [Rhizobium rosettiformans]MDR7063530.1 Arc/MetJ-type ribon-helix-helix transcriptional regulator [Rhizobium rosettiformans]
MSRRIISVPVSSELFSRLDQHVGHGQPGDAGHYANRAQLVRTLIEKFLAANATSPLPTIRQRTRAAVQPVATN